MKLSELKNIIREVIEEGKGDVSNKMRQRKSQSKFKDRQKYTKQDLESMNDQERFDIASDLDISILVDNYDSLDDIHNREIEAILEVQNEIVWRRIS